jgi:serine/threonine protein kinase/tetratricopeptide (TPR) repeat protein
VNPEEEIFEAAAALSAEERPAYLDKACAGVTELRGRVEALLHSDDASGFMDHSTITSLTSQAALGGEVIGRYRLLQQIGEGGFGVVWMAEQTEPVTRRVALKIVKAGMDTKEVIARFEAERQALAMMDHPNIARVLDAGATGNGRPYFVMELVRGIPITRFCDEQRLVIRQRLEIFADVCSAINHAHQKGVIHRDIKPSNVMVTLHGDRAVPKVIDFGIAKAVVGRLTDKTLFTQFDQFVGTPAYMSPEQTALSGLDVDTRSDIYSLGILLYELLTGKPPFHAKALLSAGFDEMRRIIREVEPPRPSSRLSTVTGDERSVLAGSRQTTPEKLHRLIEPDLDWIVMKAIEKDRTRRYETANGLALDIQRYLTDEPVSATPPTTGYRLRKFARRNKTALGAAAAVAVLLTAAAFRSTRHMGGIDAILIAATTVSTLLAVRAMQAERLAHRRTSGEKSAREHAEAVSAFLTNVLESPDPARDGRTITAAELLGQAAGELKSDATLPPERRAMLHSVLGRTFLALRLHREAIPLLETARQWMHRAIGIRHRYSLHAMRDLALAYQSSGRWTEALHLQEVVIKLNRRQNGLEHSETITALTHLSETCSQADQPAKALELRQSVLALLNRVNGADHPLTIAAARRVAESLLATGGHHDEPLKLAESTLVKSREILGPCHADTLDGLRLLADCLEAAGRDGEALSLREEEFSLRKKLHGPDHSATLCSMTHLARACYQTGRTDEALALQNDTLLRSRKLLGSEHAQTTQTAIAAARMNLSTGRRDQALHLVRELAGRPAGLSCEMLEIAALQAWLNLDADHVNTCRKLLESLTASPEPSTADRAVKACCLRQLNDPGLTEQALDLATRAVKTGRKEPRLPHYLLGLGMAELRCGRHAAACETLTTAETAAANLHPAREGVHAADTARLYRILCLLRQDRTDEARRLFAPMADRMKSAPSSGRTLPELVTCSEWLLCLAAREAESLLRQKAPRVLKRPALTARR